MSGWGRGANAEQEVGCADSDGVDDDGSADALEEVDAGVEDDVEEDEDSTAKDTTSSESRWMSSWACRSWLRMGSASRCRVRSSSNSARKARVSIS